MKNYLFKNRTMIIILIFLFTLILLPEIVNAQNNIRLEIKLTSDWGIIDLFADWFAGSFKPHTATISTAATLRIFDISNRRIEIVKAYQRNSQLVTINIDYEYPGSRSTTLFGYSKRKCR